MHSTESVPGDALGFPSVGERLWVTAGAALFLYLTLFRRGSLIYLFGPAEGGVWIDEAHRVLDGEVMYRDFFEFLTPGIVYLNAAVMALCGPRIDAFGYTAVAIGTALTTLIHALSARVVGPLWRVLPPLAFVVLLYAPYRLGDHKMPALLFGLIGIFLLATRPGAIRPGLGAGALLGLSTLFTADFGLGMMAGTALYLLVKPSRAPRACLALVTAYAATILAVMSYFALEAGLSHIFYDCVVFPLSRYHEKNVFYVDLFYHRGPRTLAHLTLCAASFASAVTFLRRGDDEGARAVSFAGLGLLLATAHRPVAPLDLAVRCTPLLVSTARALELLSRRPQRYVRFINLAVLLPLAAGILWGSLALVARRQWLLPLTRERHRAGEVWVHSPMPELFWIERNTRPDERVFLLPARGGLHFLSGTRSATSLPYVIEGQSSPEQLQRVFADIAAARPTVGIWRDAAVLPTLYHALTELYDREGEPLNGHTLFRRRAAPGTSPP